MDDKNAPYREYDPPGISENDNLYESIIATIETAVVEPSDEVDESQLLAEAEELLDSMDPTAFALLPLNPNQGENEQPPMRKEEKTAVTSVEIPKKRNMHRERMKAEKFVLQQAISTLEQQLQELQTKGNIEKHVKATSDETSVINPSWRSIAQQQLARRERAERENKRLKATLDVHNELSRQLKDAIQNRTTLKALSMPILPRTPVAVGDDVSQLETFIGELDGNYARLDEVFEKCKIVALANNTFEMRGPMVGEEDSIYFEAVGTNIMPFEFEKTRKALWQATGAMTQRGDRECYRSHDKPRDTNAFRMCLGCSQNGKTVPLRIKVVTRRYNEPDRMVLVWRALVEGESDVLAGLKLDESGWCAIEAVQAGIDDSACSKESVYVRRTWMNPPRDGVDQDKVDEFKQVVTTTYNNDMQEVSRLMQAMLLEDTIPSTD